MSAPRRVLIAGCGDVGAALGERLAEHGWEAWGLRRSPTGLPVCIRPLAADLTQPATLAGLPSPLDAVVYTAAADGRSEQAYQRAYVDGVANLKTALAAGCTRFVFVSSTGVYGQDEGQWVDETSAAAATGFTGQRLLQGEALALAGPGMGVVVRFGGIYGPGRTRLLESVRAGRACQGEPAHWTNRIHRDDCVGILHHLLTLPAPSPIYVGVDCEPATECAVFDWLAARLGVPAPARERPIPGRGAGKRCSNARLLASGYRFLHPGYREGYVAMLAEAGARG